MRNGACRCPSHRVPAPLYMLDRWYGDDKNDMSARAVAIDCCNWVAIILVRRFFTRYSLCVVGRCEKTGGLAQLGIGSRAQFVISLGKFWICLGQRLRRQGAVRVTHQSFNKVLCVSAVGPELRKDLGSRRLDKCGTVFAECAFSTRRGLAGRAQPCHKSVLSVQFWSE